jgi:hypothetical protein
MAKQTTKRTTTKTGSTSKSITKARTKAVLSEEQIRCRAYEIFLQRNGGPGDAHADWLQAERELTQELSL